MKQKLDLKQLNNPLYTLPFPIDSIKVAIYIPHND